MSSCGATNANVLRASRELGLSNSVLYEVLKGTRGVGMVVLDALKAHTGASIEAIIGEMSLPDLAAIPTHALAAEVERRGLRIVAPEHLVDLATARAEAALAEREACAKLIEELAGEDRWGTREDVAYLLQDTATAIRARKDGEK